MSQELLQLEFQHEAFEQFLDELKGYRDYQFRLPTERGDPTYDYSSTMYDRIQGHKYMNASIIQVVNCTSVPRLLEGLANGLESPYKFGVSPIDDALAFQHHTLEALFTLSHGIGIRIPFLSLTLMKVWALDTTEPINLTYEIYGAKRPSFDDIIEVIGEFADGRYVRIAERIMDSSIPAYVKKLLKDHPDLVHLSRARSLFLDAVLILARERKI